MNVRKGEWLWSKNFFSMLVYPFSLIFCGLVRLRVWGYKIGLFSKSKPQCPIIVVGSISVGGNGKTPVVQSIVTLLQQQGYKPGIVLRGYKSLTETGITLLNKGIQNDLAGDEANMLSALCKCPISVSIDRQTGAFALYEQADVDVIVSDDGLQHYSLDRDIEIIVKRELAMGNGWCLPAGPLRETVERLKNTDLVINRDGDDVSEHLTNAWNINNQHNIRALESFKGEKIHAVAGIGFPETFFAGLRAHDLEIIEHHFPDHYDFTARDLDFRDQRTILLTHKDAVKIQHLELDNVWVVPLSLQLSSQVEQQVLNLLSKSIEENHYG